MQLLSSKPGNYGEGTALRQLFYQTYFDKLGFGSGNYQL